LYFGVWYPFRRNTVGKDTGVSPSSLDALRTTWQHLSTRNNWALVTDVESFLRHATEEMNNLQDIRSPEQRMRMALTRAYSALLYERVRERFPQAVQEVWEAGYRLALRDRFARDEAEALAQEMVLRVLAKLDALNSPTSFVFWMFQVYRTARTSTIKQHPDEQPLPSHGDETDDTPDPNNPIEEKEHDLAFRQLFDKIRATLKSEVEFQVFVRYVLRGESALAVGTDLGLNPAHVRLVKSRLLKRLREDTEVIRFLQDLAGGHNPSDTEGGPNERQPRA
jgi:RNA polymerase sigma factor (sigma-70 family)